MYIARIMTLFAYLLIRTVQEIKWFTLALKIILLVRKFIRIDAC